MTRAYLITYEGRSTRAKAEGTKGLGDPRPKAQRRDGCPDEDRQTKALGQDGRRHRKPGSGRAAQRTGEVDRTGAGSPSSFSLGAGVRRRAPPSPRGRSDRPEQPPRDSASVPAESPSACPPRAQRVRPGSPPVRSPRPPCHPPPRPTRRRAAGRARHPPRPARRGSHRARATALTVVTPVRTRSSTPAPLTLWRRGRRLRVRHGTKG